MKIPAWLKKGLDKIEEKFNDWQIKFIMNTDFQRKGLNIRIKNFKDNGSNIKINWDEKMRK